MLRTVRACSWLGESRDQYNWLMDAADSPALVATLLENHRAFLSYLERRVGDRALAEDILQDAFAKVVARPEQAPTDEAVVPWFYRTLRNAAIDQFRRRGAADRAYGAFARELESHAAPTSDMVSEICACVTRLATTLKPEYAEALHAVDRIELGELGANRLERDQSTHLHKHDQQRREEDDQQ